MRVFSINGDPYEQVDVTDLSDHRLARDGLSWFFVQNNCLSLGRSLFICVILSFSVYPSDVSWSKFCILGYSCRLTVFS